MTRPPGDAAPGPRLSIAALVSLLLGLAGLPVAVLVFALSLVFQVGSTGAVRGQALGDYRLWVLLRLVGIALGLAVGVAGLLLGLRGRQRIRESAGRLTGRGLALAGVLVSAVATAVAFVFLVGVALSAS
jgi:hypothetical protein